MTRFLYTLCSIVACGLVAAGCGSNNDSGANTKTQKAPPAAPAAPKKVAKTAAVSMKNIQFSPKALTVAKGTTVKWTNDDNVNHDVTKTSGPGPKFASGTGNLAQGATYQQTLNAPGTIKYVCTVHPGMAGTITVK
jgi:plastocyanin